MESLGNPSSTHRKIPAPLFIVLGLVIACALVDIIRSYPVTFHPRFWDEAIYMIDVRAPGALFAPEAGAIRYAPAKLGYGLLLAGAVKLFGASGAMYLSTLCWLLAIAVVAFAATRRLGAIVGLIATAVLAYSPLFGKYIAEAGPTTLAALGFVLIWLIYQGRRFWSVGLVIGALATVDFKWMPPVAVSVIFAELVIERGRSWMERLRFVGGVALTAVALLSVIRFLHPPFRDYLLSYVSRHSSLVGIAPSGIFVYYLLLFGALPVAIVAAVAWGVTGLGRKRVELSEASAKSLWYACAFSCGPILFYSIFGSLKALRFYAVPYPLFAVPVAYGIGRLVTWLMVRAERRTGARRQFTTWGMAPVIAALIVVGSDGPARHLRLKSCFPEALDRLVQIDGHEGAVSSYIWPVVHYDWSYPLKEAPFTLWGISQGEKWLATDPMLDRVTIEARLALDPRMGITPDSLWNLQQTLRRGFCDSLFSAVSAFYASDYFMSEQTVFGIPALRRWRSYRKPEGNFVTIYRIDQNRLSRGAGGR